MKEKYQNRIYVRINNIDTLKSLKLVTSIKNESQNSVVNQALKIGLKVMMKQFDKSDLERDKNIMKAFDELKETFGDESRWVNIENNLLINTHILSVIFQLLKDNNARNGNITPPFVDLLNENKEINDFIKEVKAYQYGLANEEDYLEEEKGTEG